MTTINTNAPTISVLDEANGFVARIAKFFADWRLYQRTLEELRGLSPRELQDLGISPFAIRQIAYDSVYGA